MKNCKETDIVISGIGVTSSIGQGQKEFTDGLLAGQHNFNIMQRPGRQSSAFTNEKGEKLAASKFIGAEIPTLIMPNEVPSSLLRTASLSGRVALATLNEAWHDAKLADYDSSRIGLIIGGSNFQQRELVETHHAYRDRLEYLRPTYAMTFMDSDLSGLCSEFFGIKGFAFTLGGASASGQVAVHQAIQAVVSGQVDVCIAVGALMDLSYWECQSFRSLGAMGSLRFGDQPELAARPFDHDRDGFIFGECCGAVIIENRKNAQQRDIEPYARVSGWAMKMDGNRNPNPSFEGEVAVIKQSLRQAELKAQQIDYINPHGTGSIIGDEIELKSFRHCDLNHAYINASKSILGHGLSAAGVIELIVILVQMQEDKLHPTRNLENPMSDQHNWVLDKAVPHKIKNALNMSMGFGGINTAVCLQSI